MTHDVPQASAVRDRADARGTRAQCTEKPPSTKIDCPVT